MRAVLLLSIVLFSLQSAYGQPPDNQNIYGQFPDQGTYGQPAENQNNKPKNHLEKFNSRINKLQKEGKLNEDQAKMLKEQEKTYGGVPQTEIQYYEKTSPPTEKQGNNFLLKSHPLQEKSIPQNTVK